MGNGRTLFHSLSGGGHRDLSVLDPFGFNQQIGQLNQGRTSPFDHDDFQAMIVI
jgi:hypothetical protein